MTKLSQEAIDELYIWTLELCGVTETENFEFVKDRGNLYHVKDRMHTIFNTNLPLEIAGVELALSLYRNNLIQQDQYAALIRAATHNFAQEDLFLYMDEVCFKHTGKSLSEGISQEAFEALNLSAIEREVYESAEFV